MPIVSLTTLKSYFLTGKKPTQGQFENTIDTLGQILNSNGTIIGDTLYSKTVIIPTASVLTLNSVPYQIIAAPGTGKAIEAFDAIISIDSYGGTPYATNTDLILVIDTVLSTNNYQMLNQTLLPRTATCNKKFFMAAGGSADNNPQYIANKGLMLKVLTGDPTAGNSDIKVTVLYRIITL